jgi:enoyl-CoA hydratase/carnithine racemase
MSTPETLTLEKRGHVFLIGLNRPEKKNAFTLKMLRELSDAVGEYEADPELRAAVLFAHGPDFTAGLDLMDVAPAMAGGEGILAEGAYDPLGVNGKARTKPLIAAVQGLCLTVGIEFMLAADITVVADNARLAQIEIKRGIFPFGGASQRWVAASGWGNAMRYLLTGDELDGATAYRLGMAQELLPADQILAKAIEIAETVAAQAPLGVEATLRSARLGVEQGDKAAFAQLVPEIRRLMATEDAQEGVMSFMQRRQAVFKGR